MEKEKWKPIAEFSGYFISNKGRVWSEKTKNFLAQNPKSKTCPYLSVCLISEGKQKTYPVHRLVAESFLDGREKGKEVNHIDGNKRNNDFTNLEWVTKSENSIHAFNHGLRKSVSTQIVAAINSRKRKVLNIDTGKEYESIVECAKDIGGQHSGVSKCLSGERESYYGYRFRYL